MQNKSALQDTKPAWMTDESGQGESSERADLLRFSLKGTPEDRGSPHVGEYGRGAKQHGQVREDGIAVNDNPEPRLGARSFHGDSD